MKRGHAIMLAWLVFAVAVQSVPAPQSVPLIDRPLVAMADEPLTYAGQSMHELKCPRVDGGLSAFEPYADQFMQILASDDYPQPITLHVVYAGSRTADNLLTDYFKRYLRAWNGSGQYLKQQVEIKPGAFATLVRFESDGVKRNVLWFIQDQGKTSTSPLEHLVWQYVRQILFSRTDGCAFSASYEGRADPRLDNVLVDVAACYHTRIGQWLVAD